MSRASTSRLADARVTLLASVLVAAVVTWLTVELDARFKMARAHAHFAEAVRIAKRSDASRSTGEWISHYHQRIRHAPDGGPAFIVNARGNPSTGAIGISATNYGRELHITRPAYRSLHSHKVVVAAPDPRASAS